MMSNEEFVPLDQFNRIFKFWWVVVVFAVIGGLVGFFVHRSKPSVYEAKATFLASIDFNKIDFMHPPAGAQVPYEFTQYDEDISLVVVEVALHQVIPQVLTFAQQNGLAVDKNGLMGQTIIERKHAYWELRFRLPDPVLAQKIVNYWAQEGYAALQANQKAGQIPPYVFFKIDQLAEVPSTPMYFQANSLILSGAVIGLVLGILAVCLPFFKTGKGQ
jgi:hypothetical protein